MEAEAPAAAEAAVDWICVRGVQPQPLQLARVQRGGSVFAVRNQLVAAGVAEERAIRGAAGAAEHCVEAQPAELVELKALQQGAVPGRAARVALVDIRWLAQRFGGLDLVLARMLFSSLQPLPASLPAEEESDLDDDEFDENTEPEGEMPAAAAA